MEPEVAPSKQVHDELERLRVLEGEVHVDDEVAPEVGQDLAFIHDAVSTFLADDFDFRHFLHSILSLVHGVLHREDFAEAADAYDL